MLDVALPERSLLVAVEVRDGGRWRGHRGRRRRRRAWPTSIATRARRAARRPSAEPFDDDADYRLRVVRGNGQRSAARTAIRYRFSSVAVYSDGRYRLRFPARRSGCRRPADVTVTARGRADVEIAGTRTRPRGAGRTRGRASTRSGWEVSWAPRDPAADRGRADRWTRAWRWRQLSPTETALGCAVAQPARPRRNGAPTSVLLVIDRSRSVGLPGLSAERDLARRLLEALPPQHPLRCAVLRSRDQAAVPDGPAGDARGDRRVRGRDGPRPHAERHRSGGGAARGGGAAAPRAEHVRAAHAAAWC